MEYTSNNLFSSLKKKKDILENDKQLSKLVQLCPGVVNFKVLEKCWDFIVDIPRQKIHSHIKKGQQDVVEGCCPGLSAQGIFG